MRFLWRFRVVGLTVPLVLILGCGEDSEQAPAGTEKQAEPVPNKPYPDLDITLEGLDNGRINLTAPKDWSILGRRSRYVVRFRVKNVSYPIICVTAEEYPSIFNVSKDNVQEFVEKTRAALRASGDIKKVASLITPVELPGRPGIMYRRRGRSGKRHIDRLIIETVVAGRKYRFEMQALEGTLNDWRPYLFAVVHGAEFLKTGAAEKPPKETAVEVE